MKIRFWGTAAAEGIPCLFCGCAVCQEARKKKGRYIRTRSQMMVEDKILVDFNADTFGNAVRFDFDMSKLKHILITHVHGDHFYPEELTNRAVYYSNHLPHETLTLYGSEDVKTYSGALQKAVEQKRLAYCTLTAYVPYEIEGITVTPLPAQHNTPNPYLYILQQGGKTFFLCNDSGILSEETFAWLKEKKIRFDAVSYDCTHGLRDASRGGTQKTRHMGFPQIEEMRRILTANGNYKENTVEMITHFSHNAEGAGYGDMETLAVEKGLVLAYDGLEIEI